MNEQSHLDALSLDRLLAGSLPADRAAKARAHLESCEACRADLAETQAARRHFEARVFARLLPRVEAALARRDRRARLASLLRGPALLAPAGALAVALLVLVARPAPGPDVLVKGGPTLQLFALHQGSVLRVRPQTRLAAGDRLRFVVESPRAGYLLVASVDGTGKASLYFPPEGDASAPLAQGRSELPGSIELDDAPGTERLFAYFSDAPLSAAEVLRALAAAPGAPVDGVTPIETSFEKASR